MPGMWFVLLRGGAKEMTIKVTGQISKKARLVTGWSSFDHAFENKMGDVGFPLYQMSEIHGPKGVGKSTLASCIAAKVNAEGTIEYADIEIQDSDYISSLMAHQGFHGTLDWVSDEKDESLLDKIAEHLGREETSACILDSIGAISPIAERQSDLADVNMGRRAMLMAKFCRKAVYALRMRESPAVCIMLNHQLSAIGYVGTVTPGGDVKNYLEGVKIKVKRGENYDDGSYILDLLIEKNRMGYDKRKAQLFVLAGVGVHAGMTAVIDCITSGKAELKRTVQINGNSIGYMKNVIAMAEAGDPDPFKPFIAALKEG
jgi:RecA/RadA recombinase